MDDDRENTLALVEHFVDAAKVAEFLSVSRKHVLRLSKLERIPAHPISFGQRNTWRYLLSEVRVPCQCKQAKNIKDLEE